MPPITINEWKCWDVWRNRLRFSGAGKSARTGLEPNLRGILDADIALEDVDILHQTLSVTGTGVKTVWFTVPAETIYITHAVYLERTSGTFTFNDLRLVDPDGDYIIVAIGSSVTTYLWEHPIPTKMRTGWTYQANIDAHSATGNLQCHVYCKVRVDRAI